MSVFHSPRFLPTVMLLDAASVLACGVLQLLVTPWMARWTGLAPALLLSSGLFLLAY